MLNGQAISAAEQSEKSQQQFFSVMSHDMRTPLNIIIGMTEPLKTRGAEATPAVDGRKALEAFQSASAGFFDAILMDMQTPNPYRS